jgi:hypothetical protein
MYSAGPWAESHYPGRRYSLRERIDPIILDNKKIALRAID